MLKLAYRPPYDWTHVREFLAARALPGVERVDERGYARTVACAGDHAWIAVRPLPGEHALELQAHGAPPAARARISDDVRRMFDLSADPASIAGAFRSDALLAPLVARRPGLRIPGAWDPFECAVRAVLGQQVTVAGARTLAARLIARLGRPLAGGGDGLTHLFPSPAAIAAGRLDGLGITGARVAAIKALARAVLDGTVDFGAPAAQVVPALTALPGFGAWTAQYIALRSLGEPDAFPAADIVLRRMAGRGRGALTPRALEARAEAWRPWRGYAVLHLWAAAGDARRRRRA